MECRRRAVFVACALLSVVAYHAQASGQERRTVPRIALQDDGSGAAWQSLAAAGTLPIEIAVRVPLRVDEPAALERLLTRGGARRTPLWITVPPPSSRETVTMWRAGLRRIVDQLAASLVIFELDVEAQPPDVVRFATQLAAAELGAKRDGILLALGGPAMKDERRREAIYQRDVAPDIDLLAVGDSDKARAAAWLDGVDRDARIAIVGRQVPSGQNAARTIVEDTIDDLGTEVVSAAWANVGIAQDSLTALSSLDRVLTHNISAVDPQSVDLELKLGDIAPPPSLRQRLLFDATTFSTLLAYWGVPSDQPLQVSLRVPLAGTPVVVDLLNRSSAPASGYTRDDASAVVSVTVPLTGRPTLVDFNDVAQGEGTGVSAARLLTVEEVVSRHRRQQLAQDRLVKNYTAHAQMRQFFKPTITDPGYDVVTENRYFVADDGIEWERLSFSVNNRKFGSNEPFPMLQPEKAFALPLQLRLDEGYRYQLAGLSRVDDVDCYEVRFEPERDDPALYRGTVWIDRRTFARIRLQAVQSGLPGMVVSIDETQHYAAVAAVENEPVFLLSGLHSRQTVLLAGRNIQLEKTITFSGFRLNERSFEEERAASRRTDHVMYRETPNGLRPFVKEGTTRVIGEPTQSVKAIAFGVVVDPSYRFPLPIFGINYVDFAFGDSDTQLAMLFAGVLAAGNIQRPQLFGVKNLTASLDFFAIAAPSSDRVYEPAGEVESARLLTWPLSTGLNIGWQATPFQKLSLQYQFRFDGYARDTTTAESFQPPASTVTNGLGGAWEYSRGGYTAVLNAAWFARAGWKPWGDEASGTLETTPHSYAKYSASISRDVLLSVIQKFNVNAAWFGGQDLDRFGKYQFGLFDTTRIHGVPAAVRFGELGMVRGSYSLNVFEQYRVDLFLEHAWGRYDRGDTWDRIPGLGGALNLPGPWNTIVRADVGKSWLPDRYDSLGSMSLQVMLLKPLR